MFICIIENPFSTYISLETALRSLQRIFPSDISFIRSKFCVFTSAFRLFSLVEHVKSMAQCKNGIDDKIDFDEFIEFLLLSRKEILLETAENITNMMKEQYVHSSAYSNYYFIIILY